jgi:hypothetical protein
MQLWHADRTHTHTCWQVFSPSEFQKNDTYFYQGNIHCTKIQGDCKLLLAFLWHIILKVEKMKEAAYIIWKCNSKRFIWQCHTFYINVWKKILHHTSKWWLLKRKHCACYSFSNQSLLSKCNIITYLSKDLPSDNPIWQWLQQFQETASVLHRKGGDDHTLHRKMLNPESIFLKPTIY